MAASRPTGTVCWVDLSTPDPQAGGRFYRDLLGWQVSTADTPMGPYSIGETGGGPVAGLMAPAPDAADAPPGWTVFFAVDDLDHAWDRAAEAGANGLQPPLEVPGGSRIAAVTDPAGAVVGLMQPAAEAAMAFGEPGAVCWVEAQSRDLATTSAFYRALLGWAAREGSGGYWLFEQGGEAVGGLMAMPAEVPEEVPSYWLLYFGVDDVEHTCTRASELGGAVLVPTMRVEEQCFAVLADPPGAAFGVLQVR